MKAFLTFIACVLAATAFAGGFIGTGSSSLDATPADALHADSVDNALGTNVVLSGNFSGVFKGSLGLPVLGNAPLLSVPGNGLTGSNFDAANGSSALGVYKAPDGHMVVSMSPFVGGAGGVANIAVGGSGYGGVVDGAGGTVNIATSGTGPGGTVNIATSSYGPPGTVNLPNVTANSFTGLDGFALTKSNFDAEISSKAGPAAFVSTNIPIDGGKLVYTVNPGFSAKGFQVFLVFVSDDSDLGYLAGDEVDITTIYCDDGAQSPSLFKDSTTCSVVLSESFRGTTFYDMQQKTGGGNAGVDFSKVALKFYAYP